MSVWEIAHRQHLQRKGLFKKLSKWTSLLSATFKEGPLDLFINRGARWLEESSTPSVLFFALLLIKDCCPVVEKRLKLHSHQIRHCDKSLLWNFCSRDGGAGSHKINITTHSVTSSCIGNCVALVSERQDVLLAATE